MPSVKKTPLTIERVAYRPLELAGMWGLSLSYVRRLIAAGVVKSLKVGALRFILAEEHERTRRDGIPRIARGYKRMTSGPTNAGRPRGRPSMPRTAFPVVLMHAEEIEREIGRLRETGRVANAQYLEQMREVLASLSSNDRVRLSRLNDAELDHELAKIRRRLRAAARKGVKAGAAAAS